MQRFFLSDHHFRHTNIYKFVDVDGQLIRPWADNVDEADEMMVDAHNRIVGKNDSVYFMGDVSLSAKGLLLLNRMQGRKILLRGNHDTEKLKHYLPHFADIRGTHGIGEIIFSHYPLHPCVFDEGFIGNAHGHLHEKLVMDGNAPDLRYLNLGVEIAGIEPVPYEMIERHFLDIKSARLSAFFTDPGCN